MSTEPVIQNAAPLVPLDATHPTPKTRPSEAHTDLANARLYARLNPGQVLHSSKLGWLVWDKKRWKRSDKEARERAHGLGRHLRGSASVEPDDKKKERLQKRADYVERTNGLNNLLKEASNLQGVNADDMEFDTHPWLLNCVNGTLDLKTGTLGKHDPMHRLTKLCPTAYNPGAECPRFRQFLDEIFKGDAALILYVVWAIAYMLTGWTGHDIFFILYGEGRNGKSLLLRVIAAVLGDDFYVNLRADALLRKRHEPHLTYLASLRGMRVAVATETSEGRAFDESLIKQLTGGDPLRANFMRCDEFQFKPEAKLIVATNHKPNIYDDSFAIWQRVRLIPFTERFVKGDANYDPKLFETLEKEREGILAWAVQMVPEVSKGEPKLPESVRAATEQYRLEQDVVQRFLDQQCITDSSCVVAKKDMYEYFCQWNKGKPLSPSAFGKRMQSAGFDEVRKGADGTRHWSGIMLARDCTDNFDVATDTSDNTSVSVS
ncbi:MAG: hypothetical protein IT366_23945 [Candidatus Hydrogenedentes bacterium]|nr:hypothetical protein [Candidatus Hydrogenedentota bacterium]